ncbi:MAG: hypothetical protein K8I27_14775 [Planctomycetes bacterium]|nr:hypothetical protein [Planctomycetota bacterium]
MSIVYYLDFPCDVKEQVKPGRMLRLMYARERANEAMNRARKKDPDVKPEDVRVELSLKGEDRTSQIKVTNAADVQKQYSELEALSHHCRDCRARIEPGSFGCRGKIDFPLSLKAEALLLGRIRDSHGDPTGSMMCNYFESNGITGNRAAEMRKLPEVWFEGDKPLVRRLDDGRRISSNQVFEMFFLTGQISSKHARFLLGMFDLFEGALPLEAPLHSLPNLFVIEREESGMPVSRVGLRLAEKPDDDRSTRQVQNFLGGLLFASEYGCDLWVKV